MYSPFLSLPRPLEFSPHFSLFPLPFLLCLSSRLPSLSVSCSLLSLCLPALLSLLSPSLSSPSLFPLSPFPLSSLPSLSPFLLLFLPAPPPRISFLFPLFPRKNSKGEEERERRAERKQCKREGKSGEEGEAGEGPVSFNVGGGDRATPSCSMGEALAQEQGRTGLLK